MAVIGVENMPPKNCPLCEIEVTDVDEYCPECGANVNIEEEEK